MHVANGMTMSSHDPMTAQTTIVTKEVQPNPTCE